MKILKSYQNLLCLSGIGCFVSGLSLVFIPLVDLEGTATQKFFAILLALLFWLGLISETVFFVLANRKCNVIEERLVRESGKSFKGARIGAISFFTCREAAVADILSGLSAIAVIVFIVFNISNDWLFTCATVILFFSFNLHCFLNGKNYKYIKEYQKYLKRQGAKKDE